MTFGLMVSVAVGCSSGEPIRIDIDIDEDTVTVSSPSSQSVADIEFAVSNATESDFELAAVELGGGISWTDFERNTQASISVTALDVWGQVVVPNLASDRLGILDPESSYALVLIDPVTELVWPIASLDSFISLSTTPDTLFSTVDTLFRVPYGR